MEGKQVGTSSIQATAEELQTDASQTLQRAFEIGRPASCIPLEVDLRLVEHGHGLRWYIINNCPRVCRANCLDALVQNAAASKVKVSDDASSSSSTLATLDRPAESVLDDFIEEDSAEEVFYSLAELTDPKLWRYKPAVVERPQERELFLAPTIFEEVFGMSRDEFSKLPTWKRLHLKKEHNLF
mmetsp:Transcript_117052/g.233252  ORF Transcript_117052/g.233252 Transcript_117052/m.233252 type:complete len:184 (+) Transcript_117052:50-601(+)